MRLNPALRIVAVCLFILCAPPAAGANVFPWIENSPQNGARTRFYLLDDPSVEMALRVALIRQAKHTIRIATFDQSVDREVGLPILQALRDAAQRGVRVQLVMGRWPALVLDRDELIRKMLTDPSLNQPAELIQVGGPANKTKGWNISDSMHEKIFLVDDRVAIMGGRNQGASYLKWLDFGVLLTEEGQSGVLGQLRAAYEELWHDVKSLGISLPVLACKRHELPLPYQYTEVPLTRIQQDEATLAMNWQSLPAQLTNGLFPKEFRPKRMRVLTHRFWEKVLSGKYPDSKRLEMPDDILNEISQAVERGREIRFSTLFVLCHPRLKEALKTALSRQASVHIQFNGDTTAREMVPLALSYKDSLGDVMELLKAKARISVMQRSAYHYLHKKIFIVDDHVFLGSHNFNLPSSIANSEVAIEVDDSAFAEALSFAYDRDFQFSGRPLTLKEAEDDFQNSATTRWVAGFLHGFF